MKQSKTGLVKTFDSNISLKQFTKQLLWTNVSIDRTTYITQQNTNSHLYIHNDLTVTGSINNLSDINCKNNIENLNLSISEKLLNINPKQYNLENDETIHYGFIAQEVELYYPNLVKNISNPNNENIKTVNYIEFIPILLLKIKDLQNQINELKERETARAIVPRNP